MQDREDANALSVFRTLQGAAPTKTRAVASPPNHNLQRSLKALQSPPPKAEAPSAPAPKVKAKSKPKAKAMTDAEKAKTPCIFFRMPSGCRHGDKCKYSHEGENAKAKAASKPKAAAKDGSKAKSQLSC